MTTFLEDLLALRQRAIADLFTMVPAEVEFIGVQLDGDPIEDAECTDVDGTQLYVYPEDDAFTLLNTAFGLRHDGLRAFAVPYPEIPERVRGNLHAMSAYRDGITVVLRRPTPTRTRPLKFKPARENGDKSYTAVIYGGLRATQEVWAPNISAARKKVQSKLLTHARIAQIHRTPAVTAPRT